MATECEGPLASRQHRFKGLLGRTRPTVVSRHIWIRPIDAGRTIWVALLALGSGGRPKVSGGCSIETKPHTTRGYPSARQASLMSV